MNSDIFPTESDLGHREWGREILLGVVSGSFTLKRLEIKAGSRGGLQYHRKKDEIAVIISGRLLVRFDSGDGILREAVLGPNQVVRFRPGLVHQEEALTDCVLIEASTPHLNDRVRVEYKYGIVTHGGLPSTSIEEIVEI